MTTPTTTKPKQPIDWFNIIVLIMIWIATGTITYTVVKAMAKMVMYAAA